MGVHLGGGAVGGPADVSDADVLGAVFFARAAVLQVLRQDVLQIDELAGGLVDLEEVLVIEIRHTGGVVAPVFQVTQAFNDQRNGRLAAQVSNDATHR